jgi:hypothetical protein
MGVPQLNSQQNATIGRRLLPPSGVVPRWSKHLKNKQMVFEPMYLEILNNDMVGFDNTSAREMLERLFLSYGSITGVDLERNFVMSFICASVINHDITKVMGQ